MDQLLKAVQNEIRWNLDYIRDTDIFITPHPAFRPATAMLPCIGIKDGKVKHTYLAGGAKETTLLVTLCLFVSLGKQEASLIGDQASGSKGILEINRELTALLENNLLGLSSLQAAEVHDDQESTLYIPAQGAEVQHKILTLIYTRETG